MDDDVTSEILCMIGNEKNEILKVVWSENVIRILEIANIPKREKGYFVAFDEMRDNCEGLIVMHIYMWLLISSIL